MRTKKEIDIIKDRMAKKRLSGELIVHKMMSKSMSVPERFRFNLCLKIQEVKLSSKFNNNDFESEGISSEEMRRIQHKHYDHFETDRLLEILNIVLVKTKSGKMDSIKIA